MIDAKNTHLEVEQKYSNTFNESIKIIEAELAELKKEELQNKIFHENDDDGVDIDDGSESLAKTCIGITETQLKKINIKDLNKLLKKNGIKKGSYELSQIRERRRTLRNRGYARNAREK